MRLDRRIIAVIGFACLLVAATSALASPAADDRFLAGLRQRRLYRLAENFCRQQLRRSGLSDQRRAELVIELAQTCTDHAIEAAGEQRARLWQEALAAPQDFIRQEPTSPRLVLVRVQAANVQASFAGALLTDRELGAAVSLDQARVLVREAIATLQTVGREVAEQLKRKRQGEVRGPGMLTESELLSLERHARFELALALLIQARSYPAASPDRASSLAQADEILSPLAGRDEADALVWSSRLAQIKLSRLAGDGEMLRRRMAQLEAGKPVAAILAQARAEQVWLDLDAGRADEALKSAAAQPADGAAAPEWKYAVLAAYVVAWQKAAREQHANEASSWQSKAAKLAETIERTDGPPFSRQAEMLMAAAAGSAATGETAVLVKAAETFYCAGRSDEALAAYDRAQAQAEQDRQPQVAFDAGFTAAAIEHEREHYAEASRRFRALALKFPQQDRAAEAHLLAAFDAAQLSGANDPKSIAQYATLLAEQVERWPQAPSTDRARLWLGKLDESRRQWQQAIAVYGAIAATSPSYPEAVEAIGRCWPAWLDDKQAAGESTTELAAKAGDYFYNLAAPGGNLPEQWNAADQAGALAAARIWLQHTSDHFASAEHLLRAMLKSDPAADASWQSNASAWLALALAGQGQVREAGALISQLPTTGEIPTALPAVVETLVRLAGDAAEPAKRELGELALAACDSLATRPTGLSQAQRQTVGLARAQALSVSGRGGEAQETLAELAREFPRNQAIQQHYATALTAGDDATQLHAALDRWRLLEQGSKPGSEAWFRAKYGLALAHYKLGNHERAARMIELTRVLHPELGGGQLQQQFLELLKRCQQTAQ